MQVRQLETRHVWAAAWERRPVRKGGGGNSGVSAVSGRRECLFGAAPRPSEVQHSWGSGKSRLGRLGSMCLLGAGGRGSCTASCAAGCRAGGPRPNREHPRTPPRPGAFQHLPAARQRAFSGETAHPGDRASEGWAAARRGVPWLVNASAVVRQIVGLQRKQRGAVLRSLSRLRRMQGLASSRHF